MFLVAIKNFLDADIDLGFGISITERLRFAGIQAPPIIGIAKCDPEYARGIEAKQFIEQRLTINNNSFHLHTTKQGKWRRWLATIQLNDSAVTLNQELLDNNLADDWQTCLRKKKQRTTVRTMFELDRSLRSQLETRAKEQGISTTQLIRRAIEQFIQT